MGSGNSSEKKAGSGKSVKSLRKSSTGSRKSTSSFIFRRSKSNSSKKGPHAKQVSLEDFQVLRAIGKGSFGKVSEVLKKETEQKFAMKYVNKQQCIEKGAFRNVIREIEILASLDHPFLVNLWFTFQDEEDMYLVFDLISGGDLRHHIQQQRCLPESRVILYVCEIALALDYLRSKSILHRDIKPENLLLDLKGHVRLTDFNVATVIEGANVATSMSGTKPYIAPEVYRCALDLGPGYSFPVDWWSLGVCAYEMLCGQRPYDIHSKTSLEDVLGMFLLSTLTFPDYLDPGLVDLVRQLLSVEVDQRISNIDQMKTHPHLNQMDFSLIYDLKIVPSFIPQTEYSYELMNSSKPLSNSQMHAMRSGFPLDGEQRNLSLSSGSGEENDLLSLCLETVDKQFIVYNRERQMNHDILNSKSDCQNT